GERVTDEDRVRFRGVELAVGLVGDGDGRERLVAGEPQRLARGQPQHLARGVVDLGEAHASRFIERIYGGAAHAFYLLSQPASGVSRAWCRRRSRLAMLCKTNVNLFFAFERGAVYQSRLPRGATPRARQNLKRLQDDVARPAAEHTRDRSLRA